MLRVVSLPEGIENIHVVQPYCMNGWTSLRLQARNILRCMARIMLVMNL